MAKTYVIPDIHENIEWADHVLGLKQPEDRAVFLGDYFHQFSQDRTGEVCVWLKKMIERRDVTLLLGNHDQSHIGASFQILDYLCSGYCGRKQLVFEAHFPNATELTTYLKSHKWIYPSVGNRILLTHAGISRRLAESVAEVTDVMAEALMEMRSGRIHPWLSAGIDRGGSAARGGFTWGDWRNFEPVPGFRQIVGHTTLREPEEKNGSWCIDTNQQHYAVVDETGTILIEAV